MCCPQLDSCCCCCSVRIGTIVVAIVDTVLSISVFAASITQINDNKLSGDAQDIVANTFISNAVFSGIYALMSLLLLLGALKGSRNLMKPWLFYAYVYIASYFINVIIASVKYIDDDSTWAAVGLIISAVANIFLQYYFFLVVYSYYRKIPSTAVPSGPNFGRGGGV